MLTGEWENSEETFSGYEANPPQLHSKSQAELLETEIGINMLSGISRLGYYKNRETPMESSNGVSR